ncbi:DUF302 domain-containing protein [Arenicella sp. 4NH20-0111]|uniref:DUF302 domain-containing protein n=1 Tax=Arenicella sp. 4NH20-0111 TaxID=3127648 RepID=UPI0031075271
MNSSAANEQPDIEPFISVTSSYSVPESGDRLEKALIEKGLTLFARINHSENAASVDMSLTPTEVIIFGNPKAGTPLMQCSASVAIDLPQKMLIREDAEGVTHLTYNNPLYLQIQHGISGCDAMLSKVSDLIAMLAKSVAN